ncbi:MAG: hypothetical protein Q8K59_01775 [Nitrosomonas sp.]|nr:hypothetical protein [Nitrosomonas sp.]MDP1949828.1 hypothetical protein [Nitrosomonas sp.]
MLCPKCETENTDQNEICSNCGENLLDTSAQVMVAASNKTTEVGGQTVNTKTESNPIVHQRITDIDLKPESSKSDDGKAVSNGFYLGIMIATVIFPIIGVIMGFTYMRKNHPTAKKAGKSWLIVGSVMILVNIVVISMN